MNINYIPNTSSIPNILFDYWMDKLSPAEFKVLMCVARKTYGWHKDYDTISLKQIEKMTGLHKSGIVKNVDRLMELGLLTKIKSKTSDGDDAPNKYEINIYCVGGGSLQNRLPVVDSVDKGVVYSVDTQKKDYTKENIQNISTPSTPPSKEAAAPPAAKAAEEGVNSCSKQKKVKATQEFSSKVKEVSDAMIAIIQKHHPVYRLPDNLDKFMEAVKVMIEKDGQSVDVLLKTFEWACSDTEQRDNFKGWQSVICANKKKGKPSNPAEIFRGHFSVIYSQMKSQPKRKFAPSSKSNYEDSPLYQQWIKDAI